MFLTKYFHHKDSILYEPSFFLIQREKYKNQIGFKNAISQIRILYPRCETRADLTVSDLFSVILWDVLDSEFRKDPSINIKIDRDDSINNSNDAIMRDIRSEDCLIVIIITKEGLDKDNHPTFFKELKECHRVISHNEKNKRLFIPFLLCSPKAIDDKGIEMYNLIATHNLERVEDFFTVSLNNGLKPFKNMLLNKIKHRIKSIM